MRGLGLIRLCIFAVSSLLPLSSEAQQNRIPNAILELTVRQKEGDKTEKGLHLIQVFCWDSRCSVTTLSLNQCGESGDGEQAFYPKIQRYSTVERNLEVWAENNVLVMRETGFDIGGDFVTTLRIGFHMPSLGEPATKVISFSGGFVKNSSVLEKVLNVEYIPLQGAYQAVRLDCAVLLPGVAAK